MEDLLQLKKIEAQVLKKLLEDKTTGKNIIWATDSYENLGPGYERNQQIRLDHLQQKDIIKPRIQKDLEVQKDRTKKNAEVHTPAWIVNQMNNLVDLDWLKNDSNFNREIETTWIQNEQKVAFKSHSEKWKSYVRRKVLEITCGEAPFLTSRYDCSNGQKIEVKDRIGLLDRKLRIVTENTTTPDEWIYYALTALKSIYGYEIQGDSLLIGRLNIYLSFLETAQFVWKIDISLKDKVEIADIISWNVLQMDGLTYKTPSSTLSDSMEQLTLFNFDSFDENNNEKKVYEVKINLWGTSGKTLFSEMKGSRKMKKKFDVIIGNPPYQESDGGAQSSAKPVYNLFVEAAMNLKPKVIEMIIPTRWYSGGKGLDEFRKKMLSEKHLQYLYDCLDPNEIFPNTNIRGGVCYFQLNSDFDNQIKLPKVVTRFPGGNEETNFRPIKIDDIDVFIRHNSALKILNKVKKTTSEYINDYVSSLRPFGFRGYFKDSPDFHSSEKGLIKPIKCVVKGRKIGFVEDSLIKNNRQMISNWKVFIPRANNIGTELSDDNLNSFVGEPNMICTESFLVIGGNAGLSEQEANNLSKYLKTRFARFMHSISKSSQDATSKTWKFVPIQNFVQFRI